MIFGIFIIWSFRFIYKPVKLSFDNIKISENNPNERERNACVCVRFLKYLCLLCVSKFFFLALKYMYTLP